MTLSDLARAARIAAFRFSMGMGIADAERWLLQYMPAIEPANLERALYYGRLMSDAANQINTEHELQAEATLQEIYAQFPGGVQVLAHYQIGPNVESDWRSVPIYPGANANPEEIRRLAREAVSALISGAAQLTSRPREGWGVSDAVASITYAYVGSTGLGAL